MDTRIFDVIPADLEGFIADLLFWLTHVLIIVSILLTLVFLLRLITAEDSAVERLLRAAAFAAALLLYVAGRAYGVSIPKVMLSSIEVTNPISTWLWGAVAPFSAGTLVALFCITLMRRDSDVAARGLVLFAALMFTMFADAYALVARRLSPNSMKLVLPNMTFVLGIILYAIFRYRRQ